MSLYGGIELPDRPDPENVRKLDLLCVPQIRRMRHVGVAIDPDYFHALGAEFESEAQALHKDITSLIPPDKLEQFLSDSRDIDEININSAEQMADLLFGVLGVGRGQRLKTTKSGKRLSTGKKQLEQLKREHAIIPKMLEYKECCKLKSDFCDKLPRLAIVHPAGKNCPVCGLHHYEQHSRIHATVNTTRVVAGRLSMKDPNLQQIPSRTKRGQKVRRGFVASRGRRLVTRDASQLHLRLIASLANETTMISIFNAGGDIHVETARRAFGLGPDETPDKHTQRAPSKATNFLIAYGGNEVTLYDTLVLNFALANMEPPDWLTVDWCRDFQEIWFRLYPKVRPYFAHIHWMAKRYGFVWDQFGRVRWVPEVRSVHDRVVNAGLRQGGNHPIIAMEAGLMKIAQARVEDNVLRPMREAGAYAEAVIPVHDEFVMEIGEDEAELIGELVGEEMGLALTDEQTGERMLAVPLKVDGGVGTVWEKD
jgi:DNA polymerase-1